MTAVYQGEPGAFSEAAAEALLPGAAHRGLPTFQRVFEAVASGEAQRGIVPVENSVFGSVPEVLDLLAEYVERHGIAMIAERWHRVEQALLGLAGTALEDVREVRSHPQALGQAAAFLQEQVPNAARVSTVDTAGAARQVAADRLHGVAAVASRRAAELYGLEVLAEHVEADRRNYTRFALLAPGGTAASSAERTSLVLTPSTQSPNALFRALTAFVGRRLALYRVEPRPRLGRPGHYHYHIDVEGGADQEPLSAAIADARAFCDRLLVLGSYAASPVG